jgi:ATP-binding cassette subfamily C protein LapB
MGLWGACLVIQNHIGIAELAACMLLNGRIIQPLTKLMTLWVQSENVSVARGRLNDMEELEVNEMPSGQVPEILGQISVREMAIERTDSAGTLMAPVSFLVPPSGCVLLEAEQSWMVDSVFDAISGQRLPSNGEVLIDGFSGAERVNQKGQGATIVLEANPAMFSGTLLENLSAFGDAQVVERAKRISAALGLEKRIHRLPAGYNTVMTAQTSFEKDPVNRHLVSLTRALALQPKILLMNEPSAALDTPERQALADCFRTLEPRPTIVLSSPDPRLRQLADQVVHLKAKLSDEITSWRDDAELDRRDALLKQRGAA